MRAIAGLLSIGSCVFSYMPAPKEPKMGEAAMTCALVQMRWIAYVASDDFLADTHNTCESMHTF